MNRLRGHIELTRPVNALICGLSVVCGGLLDGTPSVRFAAFVAGFGPGDVCQAWMSWRLLSAAVSASAILGAGNVLNDLYDRDCDRINAPHRPLVSGAVSPRGAAIQAILLTLAGILLAIPMGPAGLTVAVGAALLLALYDSRLKRIPLAGNISVALLGGLAFLYGGIAADAPLPALVPAVFALFYHLGRELIKDAADVRGDAAAGIATVATRWGTSTAVRLGAGVLLMLCILILTPVATGAFGMGYAITVVAGLGPVMTAGLWLAVIRGDEVRLRRAATVLKWGMPLGIIAVFIGFQGW